MALMETLQDDFSAGVPNALWPTAGPSTHVGVAGGALSITSSTSYYLVQSATAYTIVGSYLAVRVIPGTPSGSQSQQTFVTVDVDSNNFVAMFLDAGTLKYQKRQAGVDSYATIGAYDPAAMAWWRIRHDGTGFRFGYSADGLTYTETAATTTSWSAAVPMRATLMVGQWDGADPPVTSMFDSVNVRTATTPAPAPIVADRYTAQVMATQLLGVGPWNASVPWRGAPNRGIPAGARVSSPALNLPTADSLSVNMRLGEASESRTSHYFPRHEAIVIEENVTDLWWRRRDPRRQVVDRIGRFNASTVDIDMQADGGVNVNATFVDYYGLLADRINMAYLTPATNPPTTQWATNTLITDILRWAIPTNMGLDLTGIQAATPDITAKLKSPYELPLGTRVDEMMEGLQRVSDKPWEWWVEMPASDLSRPRLTLATTRGADRGIILFDIGGAGPIESWSVQRAGDKYANALLFFGDEGGVVKTFPDQIAEFGQRDAYVTDTSVTDINSGGVPTTTHLNAAADTKLAELAANQPSYQVVLRQGFWEGRSHIDVGDWVGIRLELGADVLTGKHRVSEIQIDIDAAGYETVTLTLGTARPSKDPRSRASSTARLVRYLRKYESRTGALN